MDEDLSQWHEVGPTEGIDIDTAVIIPLLPPVAVYRLDDGFYASDDTCTHAESSLGDGWIEDGKVECEFHFAKFDIRSGKSLTPPANVDLVTYPTRVECGLLYVDLRRRTGCAVEQLGRI